MEKEATIVLVLFVATLTFSPLAGCSSGPDGDLDGGGDAAALAGSSGFDVAASETAGAAARSAAGLDDPSGTDGAVPDGTDADAGTAEVTTGGIGGAGAAAAGGEGGESGNSGAGEAIAGGEAGESGPSGAEEVVPGGNGGENGISDAGEVVPGGTGGHSSTGGTGGTTGGYQPPCITSPTQVLIIGDSYITLYLDAMIGPRIAVLAQADGALAPFEGYRDFAFPGTSLGDGAIPSQFADAAVFDPDIRLVIMDGGGNDVLLLARQCLEPGSSQDPQCQAVVQNAIDQAVMLFEDMAATGVSDVIYFFYPHIPSCLFSGTAPNEILDYAYVAAQENCDSAEEMFSGAIRCHFIDLRPVFGDEPYPYINPIDCIHPLPVGADLIAEQVYNVMKNNCLGQPESKGCCVP